MIRHELARIFRALADRLEVEKPAAEIRTEIQYVYVYSVPPTVTPSMPVQPWQSPFYHTTCEAMN